MTQESTAQRATPSPDAPREVAAIILAAGKSTRMKSDLPKVMHALCGRPMLAYVLDACRDAGVSAFHLVVGFGKDAVTEVFSNEPGVRFAVQAEQNGTGHAVSICADGFSGFVGDVIVIAGDMPLVRPATLEGLLGGHRASGAAASIATTVLEDPTGYGRIVRDADGAFVRIVEHRDCDAEQLGIKEVNPSYYCFDAQALFEALPLIKPDNAKGEYYLTDVLTAIRKRGGSVRAVTSVPAEDAMGINARADLADVARHMQRRIQRNWMDHGVTIIDPDNTWIDSPAVVGQDTVIKPFSYVEGNAKIGARCSVGPFAYVADGAVMEDGANIGPGVLTALDSTLARPGRSGSGSKPDAQVVRRPPARSSCP